MPTSPSPAPVRSDALEVLLGPDEGRSPDRRPVPLRRWAPVTGRERTAENTWWLEVRAPEIASASVPGQFLMIGYGLENTGAPLLPRPFSVGGRTGEGRIGLLLRSFGAGTRRMATLDPGDEVLLLGPLGRPFRLEEGRRVLCVAGGVGLAPFLFLAGVARRGGLEVDLLYGERTAERVFDPGLLERIAGGPAEVWTEDGTAGSEGLVLEGIELDDDPLLLGCGPDPMLRALAELARERGADLQVSVEEHMGCGVGTCQGCVVRGADGRWIKSCIEGPVFDAGELDWSVPRA